MFGSCGRLRATNYEPKGLSDCSGRGLSGDGAAIRANRCQKDSLSRNKLALRAAAYATANLHSCAAHLEETHHSATILLSVAICFHCAKSCLTIAPNAVALIDIGVAPSGSSSAFSSGDAEIALISRFKRSTI